MTPQIFRFRVTLIARANIALPPHHAATLYGLLAAALGRSGEESGIPVQLLLDAPEQARTLVRDGDPYAFGLTWIAPSPEEAAGRMAGLLAGLHALAAQAGPRAPKWGGNFQVSRVEDLVLGGAWDLNTLPFPVPISRLRREAAAVAAKPEVTLFFTSPLREERGDHQKREGHGFFDGTFFDVPLFLKRLNARLRRTGFADLSDVVPHAGDLAVTENRLVWLDISYGPAERRKTLGGAVGRVRIRGLRPEHAATLVLGQYVRTGQSTKFGFGKYRISELGPDLFESPRATGLLGVATHPLSVARTAKRLGRSPDVLRQDAAELAAGRHVPGSSVRLAIPKPDGGERLLAIPGRRDMALQRLVSDAIAPALNEFFEQSSLACRRGLGRERAAGEVRRAFREGYVWAVKSDFHCFFDEVNHEALEDRLLAYLADEGMVAVLMAWVRGAAPEPGRGLPTGSPLSPLLANLFLDHFDERVATAGGRLARYADDFLILCRTREEADRLHARAAELAKRLRLTLNARKTALIDLTEPFDFLGFRFSPRGDGWLTEGPAPANIADIGREQSRRDSPPARRPLPGETAGDIAVIGPGLEGVYVQQGHLFAVMPGETEVIGRPLDSLRKVVIMGSPPLGPGVFEAFAAHGITAVLTDDSGNEYGVFHGGEPKDLPPDQNRP